MVMEGRGKVQMYVRKGPRQDESERVISVSPLPRDVPLNDLVRMGLAIDGNAARVSVDASTHVKPDGIYYLPDDLVSRGHWGLPQAINAVQRFLVDWFAVNGYEVEFK
jgi:hypothetical protein